MKPEYPRQLVEAKGDAQGYIATLSPYTAVGNLASALYGSLKRSTRMSPLAGSDNQLLAHWAGITRAHDLSALARVMPDPQLRALVSGAAYTPVGSKTSLDLGNLFREFLGNLVSTHFVATDYSKWMAQRLTADNWAATWVVDPTLGYPRPSFSFGEKRTGTSIAANFGAFGLASVQAKAMESFVRTLDMPMLSVSLLSEMTRSAKEISPLFEGRDPTERPIGEFRRVSVIMSEVVTMTLAQMLTSLVYDARWHLPFIELCSALFRSQRVVQSKLLQADEDLLRAVRYIAAYPLHPLLAWCAAGPSNAEAIGLYGRKKAWIASSASGLPLIEADDLIAASKPSTGFPLVTLYEQVLQFGVRQAVQFVNRSENATAEPATDGLETPSWPTFAQSVGLFDWREIASALMSSGADGLIQIMGKKMHWTDANDGEPLGLLDFWGSQFAMTDGDAYTRPFSQVVAGAVPVLSLNAKAAYPIDPYHLKTWNRSDLVNGYGGSIKYCAATIVGLFNSNLPERAEESIIPSGMGMGEQHAEMRWLPPVLGQSILDPVTSGQMLYWSMRSPVGYANRWWSGVIDDNNNAQRPAMPPHSRWSDWAPYSYDDAGLVTDGLPQARERYNELITEWGTVFGKQLEQAQNVSYLVSADHFRMRFPVQVDWANRSAVDPTALYYVDLNGMVSSRTLPHGWVEGDSTSIDELEWTAGSPKSLEDKVISMVNMWDVPGLGGVVSLEVGTIAPARTKSNTFAGVEFKP
jgi:hypothetical protein